MANQSLATASVLRKKTPWQRFWINFGKSWQLHLMLLLPLTYMIIFHYAPMFGLQIAFRDYRTRAGMFASEWVGLYQYESFFANYKWSSYVWNTFKIASYSIVAGFPMPIILALFLHVNNNTVLKKLTQNVSYIPHFISAVVMVGILNRIFDPFSGIWGTICRELGVMEIIDIRTDADAFIHLYVLSGVWQGMGWGAIMYVSALSAVSPELHEAARIDGASRFRRVLSVDLPAIMPTVCILLIMRMGGILNVGHEKAYLMQNSLNIVNSEIISTYVYKSGLASNNLSYGSAVGLMNGLVSTFMVVTVNWITNKLSDGEAGLF